MDSATEDQYLQKLEEFVYDEEKIVTPRWLSSKLDINIAQSRCLLEKYVSDLKDIKQKDVTVAYLLSGIGADDNLHITVVKEQDISKTEHLYTKIVDRQIYSVQKSKELDLNILSNVDHFDMHNPKDKPIRGAIVSKQCIQRIFKSKKLISEIQKPKIEPKPSIFAKVPPKSSVVKNEEFTATSATTNSSTKGSTSKSAKESNTKTKQSNGFTSFFNKASTQVNAKPAPEKSNIKLETAKAVSQENSLKNCVNKLVDSESDGDDANIPTQTTPKNNENHKPKRSTKRQKKNNNKGSSPKRRKRIIQQESDSDDMFASEKEDAVEDIIDNSEEEIPQPKPKPPLAPKNKKRKLVDRTYTDAEGYVITTKEWVDESPSEDEVTPEVPKAEPKKIEEKVEVKSKVEDKKLKKSESSDLSDTNNKDNKALNGKSKGGKKGKKALASNQPTLMNFFKRS